MLPANYTTSVGFVLEVCPGRDCWHGALRSKKYRYRRGASAFAQDGVYFNVPQRYDRWGIVCIGQPDSTLMDDQLRASTSTALGTNILLRQVIPDYRAYVAVCRGTIARNLPLGPLANVLPQRSSTLW